MPKIPTSTDATAQLKDQIPSNAEAIAVFVHKQTKPGSDAVKVMPEEVRASADDELAVDVGGIQPARMRDHRRRDVHADDGMKGLRERAADATDTAPKVEDPAARNVRRDPRQVRQEARCVRLAGLEELVDAPDSQPSRIVRPDRAERIALGEIVPVATEPFELPGHRFQSAL